MVSGVGTHPSSQLTSPRHPDKHRGEEKERAELEFKRILWAYEALTKQTRNSFSEFCDQWTAYGAEWTQFYDLNEGTNRAILLGDMIFLTLLHR